MFVKAGSWLYVQTNTKDIEEVVRKRFWGSGRQSGVKYKMNSFYQRGISWRDYRDRVTEGKYFSEEMLSHTGLLHPVPVNIPSRSLRIPEFVHKLNKGCSWLTRKSDEIVCLCNIL